MPLILFIHLLLWSTLIQSFHTTIMLAPSGDARQVGRIIGNSFERTITYNIAHAIKKNIESKNRGECIINRSPGEIIEPIHNAQFANKLPLNLYVSIHCFQHSYKRALYVYFFSHENRTQQSLHPLQLIPFDQAYLLSLDASKKFSSRMLECLRDTYGHSIDTFGPFGIPCAPLMGIKAPALCIELYLTQHDDWMSFIEPISEALYRSFL